MLRLSATCAILLLCCACESTPVKPTGGVDKNGGTDPPVVTNPEPEPQTFEEYSVAVVGLFAEMGAALDRMSRGGNPKTAAALVHSRSQAYMALSAKFEAQDDYDDTNEGQALVNITEAIGSLERKMTSLQAHPSMPAFMAETERLRAQ